MTQTVLNCQSGEDGWREDSTRSYRTSCGKQQGIGSGDGAEGTSNPQDVELDEMLGQAAGKRQGRGVLKRSGEAVGRRAKGEQARVGPAHPFDEGGPQTVGVCLWQ